LRLVAVVVAVVVATVVLLAGITGAYILAR
jgi:hypothetical protein